LLSHFSPLLVFVESTEVGCNPCPFLTRNHKGLHRRAGELFDTKNMYKSAPKKTDTNLRALLTQMRICTVI
jgi:hypothetical protein